MVSNNFNFLVNQDLNRYAGEWIAVSGNKVVANGESATEVLDKASIKSKEKPTIMRVPEGDQVLLL
jgi:hypothetical protein